MAKEIIEVVDTAVKIGLGALISGITAYAITHKNHVSEQKKESRSKKSTILEFVVENIEAYLNVLAEYISDIDGRIKAGIPPGTVTHNDLVAMDIIKRDNELLSIRSKAHVARSRLRLIGEEAIVAEIKSLFHLENDFRQQVIFNMQMPDKTELNSYYDRLDKVRKDLYTKIEKAYSKTLKI